MNSESCRTIWTIAKRELVGYFNSPVAYVFIVIFLLLNGFFTFMLGNYFLRGEANLNAFLMWHPWLYLFLVPAISMRLWSEERKQGTIELFLTLPIGLGQAVLGKFLAAWAFACVALALTVPLWVTVGWLGNPDHGAIAVGYLACALLSGCFLAVGAFLSAFTKNQVIAFVLCGVASFLLLVTGFPVVLDFVSGWMPRWTVEAISAMSALTHFESMMRGVLDLRDVLYFVSLTAAFLFLNGVVVEWKKAE